MTQPRKNIIATTFEKDKSFGTVPGSRRRRINIMNNYYHNNIMYTERRETKRPRAVVCLVSWTTLHLCFLFIDSSPPPTSLQAIVSSIWLLYITYYTRRFFYSFRSIE
jgi:hypothetical protein